MLALLLSGCVGSGEIPARVSGQIVDEYEAPLGPGLVMIEFGPVHDGAYQLGALIDDDGRFTVDLPSGGTWGLHLFTDGYQYLPAEITIEDHQQVILTSMMISWGVWMDLTGEPSWPTQPTDATLVRMPVDETIDDNPVMDEVSVEDAGDGYLELTADVWDPDEDLSRMVLAYDSATGTGYALNPPEAPDTKGNYPDGTYSTLAIEDSELGDGPWYFVVSDNMCNDTDIWILP
ncbi:MAG TPA: hypothetical protein QGF58_26475 [Myxococcota bacterium]|nr:hypothetical protein [Myxococcota bacterium]